MEAVCGLIFHVGRIALKVVVRRHKKWLGGVNVAEASTANFSQAKGAVSAGSLFRLKIKRFEV